MGQSPSLTADAALTGRFYLSFTSPLSVALPRLPPSLVTVTKSEIKKTFSKQVSLLHRRHIQTASKVLKDGLMASGLEAATRTVVSPDQYFIGV